jgi:hypothetical protein
MKKANFKLKKMWGLTRSYKEAVAIATEKNVKILAKAEIGQEIIMNEKAIKYFGWKSLDVNYTNGEKHITKPRARFETNYTNVIKLGAKHPELAEKLDKLRPVEFEADKYIYAGDGVCYYTGKDWGRRPCDPHYNGISAWAPYKYL